MPSSVMEMRTWCSSRDPVTLIVENSGEYLAALDSRLSITWLMRLEGHSREEWEPEIEAARQTYRLLAERADASGDQATTVTSRWRCHSRSVS